MGSKLNSNANAVSASKLATARTIALGDNLTGSANFDGSGNITINGRLSRTNLTGSTTDLNTLNNSDGISSKRYIETTTGGCANISNAPVKEPFTLDVESIRYASNTDYITKQTFISATTKITYERFCINGTWSGWSQVYTSINKPNKSDVGLSNVDNTRDLDKPISTATQNALNGKANSNHNHDDRYYTESEIDGKVSTLNSSISGKVSPTGTIVANRVPIFSDTTGKVIKDSGFTIAASVPSGAKFTDTNTWRGVQDNLTSTLTDQSLSANQGKVLKGLIDGKANSNHTHDDRYYTENEIDNKLGGKVPTSSNSSITVQADADSSSTSEYISLRAGGNELKIISSAGGSSPAKTNNVFYNGNALYHTGHKPSKGDVGLGNVDNTSDLNKPISTATQNALNGKLDKSGGTLTGNVTFSGDNELSWIRNSDYAKIKFKNTNDNDTDSYMEFKTGDNGNEYFKFNQVNGSTTTELMTIKSDHLRFKGNAVYHVGNKPTKADIGLSNVDNTSDLNKPISTATQNALNGKANTSHTHTKSQITDMPTTMKNPNALTVQFNGTTNKTYDGGSAQTVNITPSAIGAATNNHTHNYAGSSSAGGAANSAVKLATARTIALTGNVTGSANFDGSGNITINTSGISAIPTNTVSALFN